MGPKPIVARSTLTQMAQWQSMRLLAIQNLQVHQAKWGVSPLPAQYALKNLICIKK